MLNRIKKRHIVLLTALIGLSIIAILYLRTDQNGKIGIVRPYDDNKDFHAIVKLVNDNKYWISERPDFSPEKMLISRAPSNEPEKKGLVNIDVVEVEDQTGGFIAYYKKSNEHGFIWLLAVNKDFRGQGLGEQLAAHALIKFKKQGVRYVTLATRLINKPALALYKKLGFVEKNRDEERGIITLIKRNL